MRNSIREMLIVAAIIFGGTALVIVTGAVAVGCLSTPIPADATPEQRAEIQRADRIANLSRLDAVLDIVSEEYAIYLESRAPEDLDQQLSLVASARELVRTAVEEYLDDGRYSLDDLLPVLAKIKAGYLGYVETDTRLTDDEKAEKQRRARQVEALVRVLVPTT